MPVGTEIVTEAQGDWVEAHGVGLHPTQQTKMTVPGRYPHRAVATALAQRFMEDPVLTLSIVHPTGFVYTVTTKE